MKKILLVSLLVGLLLLCLSGCGEPAATDSVTSSEETMAELTMEPAPAPEPDVPSGTSPLTGLPMEERYESNRPVAVMLNNLKAAQPQLGVSQADLIYEVVAEGGITRMLALYQSLDGVGNLGSIRSTRAYYLELALGHDALLVHAGGSPEAYADIPTWGVDNMDGVNGGSDADIFWRDAQRRKTAGYEHSMLTSGEKIQDYAREHFRTELADGAGKALTFVEDGTPIDGTAAREIQVKFSPYKTGVFTYDTVSSTYLVSQYGGPYTDGNTGEQVGVTNVLVLETTIYAISGDSYGRLKVDLTGSGNGTFFCGGKSQPIFWSKNSRNEPFVYTRENGAPLALGQGPSYVCILSPKSSSVTVS